ncbi:secondary thiamine-phosphate synthase enzyme YjbQ [Roseospirillum parvum]|uniref:Secondary thiamine-phosphate synthase enzyme n=1 Tax=Roseospirillum parvum TaxID=83401 RepID=A0A1G7WMN2_9PROT|nr:secondary thiamine-phosphate synthase enzyme YjbQ [Roseospirillum parvum]SDG73128.1 secondary thiamine-phosphate synthase enzyme [Roseospirillum parvum]
MAGLRQASTVFKVATRGRGLHEITDRVAGWVGEAGFGEGLLTLFIRHTSASLIIQENADPDVRRDLVAAFDRLAPEDHRLYAHQEEGPDDMPAHIKSTLSDVSLSIPLLGGRLALGTWQGIYVAEHRARPHTRQVVAHLIGE